MGYPVYKLLRMVNRQYPNNGFINPVNVTEELTGGLIDEDLRDLINETLQEIYIDVAIDEVYSFPTVPGQNQYELPEDCDLRDIQEVTRTYQGRRGPLKPPPGPGPLPPGEEATAYFDANGGTGTMDPIEVAFGENLKLPQCTFTAPSGLAFYCWLDNSGYQYYPGDEVSMFQDETFSAKWDVDPAPVWEISVRIYIANEGGEGVLHYKIKGESQVQDSMSYGDDGFSFTIPSNQVLVDVFDELIMYDATNTAPVANLINYPLEGTNVEIPVNTTDVDPAPDWDPTPDWDWDDEWDEDFNNAEGGETTDDNPLDNGGGTDPVWE